MENKLLHEKINRGMCRVCLCGDRALIDIFTFSAQLAGTIADGVAKCTSVHVKIEKHIKLPTTICDSCYMQLIQTHKFQQQALQSEKTLQLYLIELQDDDKQKLLGRSDSCIGTNAAKQTNKNNSTIKPSESGTLLGRSDSCIETNAAKRTKKDNSTKKPSESKTLLGSSDSCIETNTAKQTNKDNSTKKPSESRTLLGRSYSYIETNAAKQIKIDNSTKKPSESGREEFEKDNKVSAVDSKPHTERGVNNSSDGSDSEILNERNIKVPRNKMMGPYRCEFCNKYYKSSSILSSHRSIHFADLLYQCSICTSSFSKLTLLKKHQEDIHTGALPYQCDRCDKWFSNSSNLKIHQRGYGSHRNRYKYQCDLCKNKFSLVSALNIHKNMHTRTIYKCLVCNNTYHALHSLKLHQKFKPSHA